MAGDSYLFWTKRSSILLEHPFFALPILLFASIKVHRNRYLVRKGGHSRNMLFKLKVVSVWNKLPEIEILKKTVNAIKTALDKLWITRYIFISWIQTSLKTYLFFPLQKVSRLDFKRNSSSISLPTYSVRNHHFDKVLELSLWSPESIKNVKHLRSKITFYSSCFMIGIVNNKKR